MSINFTINTLILTKKYQYYNSEKVKDKEKRGCNYKQFEIIDNRGQEPKSTKKEEAETKKTLTKYKSHHGLSCLKNILSH